MKTFMFTDMVGSTQLVEALGDEAWEVLLRWHDETLRALFAAHQGEEVAATGDGFFVGFDSPDAALACAVAVQRRLAEHRRASGFAPQVRIGVHASEATRVAQNFRGKGVHEAARISALAGAGEIFASEATAAGSRYRFSDPRSVTLKGIAEPVDVVSIDWR
jgi:class 3 adenylate cyclase